MMNPRLARRYAKSLLGLAIERNQLDETYNDILFLQNVCKSNREFTVVLRSPVISPDKKETILEAVTKGKISALTDSFIRLLIRKGREMNLPEITTAFIDQYKQHKHIHTINLTTATPVSEEIKKEIVEKVKSQSDMKNIELTTTVDEDLIGGVVFFIGDTPVPAGGGHDPNAIKKQFLNNDFIYKIR